MWMVGPNFDFNVRFYVYVGMLICLKLLNFHIENVAEGLDTDPLGSERVFECGWLDQILTSKLRSCM
jgi:hypothetical protein